MSFCCGLFPTRAIDVSCYWYERSWFGEKKWVYIHHLKQICLMFNTTINMVKHLEEHNKQLFYIADFFFSIVNVYSNIMKGKNTSIFFPCIQWFVVYFQQPHCSPSWMYASYLLIWNFQKLLLSGLGTWLLLNFNDSTCKRIRNFRKFYLYCFILQERCSTQLFFAGKRTTIKVPN